MWGDGIVGPPAVQVVRSLAGIILLAQISRLHYHGRSHESDGRDKDPKQDSGFDVDNLGAFPLSAWAVIFIPPLVLSLRHSFPIVNFRLFRQKLTTFHRN